MLGPLLVILIGLSLGYGALTLVAAARLGRRPLPRDGGFTPPVTLLKPIKGLDSGLLDNLRSYCQQDYPNYQVLFGLADLGDPAVPTVRQVLAEHPDLDARLIHCPEPLGPNGKVSTLHQLVPLAQHDIFVVSDSDTRVARDYLRRIVALLADPSVGVVTALYRGAAPAGLAAQLERLLIQAGFVPGVLAAHLLEGMTFALGATMALRRKALEELGGFAAFAHILAEDYQMAHRAAAAGYGVGLADTVVDCVLGRVAFQDFFARQVRWARTTRSCRPLGYLVSVIRHGVFWSLLLLVLQGPTGAALLLLAASAALRLAVAARVSAGVLRAPIPWRGLCLLPLADALGLVLWALAFTGNTVTWRGVRYRMGRAGLLTPLATPQGR